MPVDAILGLQWGDEGKGKIIDCLAAEYQAICRFGGGPNAGHTIENPLGKYVLHQLPSGILREDTMNLLGAGMVIDIIKLIKEMSEIEATGINIFGRILIAREAHLILPTHIVIDEQRELHAELKIGSTKRGIGPTYEDKIGRRGIRIGDILAKDFYQKVQVLSKDHLLRTPGQKIKADFDAWLEAAAQLLTLIKAGVIKIVDSVDYLYNELQKGTNILAEGAQGVMLDIDFGTVPFVTSSSTASGGICNGLGVPPTAIRKIIGVTKAYATRVGNGPFPTELFDKMGESLQRLGNEKGATTGRTRRCGWLDIPLLAYAIKLTGTTELVVTKLDILEQLPYYKICVAYRKDGERLTSIPFSLEGIEPVYKTYQAGTPFIDVLKQHLHEAGCHVHIKYVSTGPKREALTIYA